MKKLPLLILFLTLHSFLFAQKYYSVDQIPNPKLAGQDYFVSDPDGILSNVTEINGQLALLEQQTRVEFAIVVMNDFAQDEDDFEFAKAIFDKWGIGKAGSNNGLLLFIAKDRRKYRFISGDGVEGLLPDVILKQVGEQNLVPAFREDRYGEGIMNAVNEINLMLTNPQNIAEIQNLISNEKQKSADWQYAAGGSILVILIFFFVFSVFNRQAKKDSILATNSPNLVIEAKDTKKTPTKHAKKKNKVTPADQNGYDAVYKNGCIGVFFFVFISIFVLAFSGGFGLFDNFRATYIPYILYVILAITLFFRYYYQLGNLRRKHFDDENFLTAVKDFHVKNWWLVIFSPLIIISLIIHAIKKAKMADRFQPLFDSRNMEMFRMDRDLNLEGEPFLTKGQRKEEIIKAYDYDIWQSADKKEHLIKVWPAEAYDDFIECPKCKFRTYQLNKQETTKPATYSSSGTAKISNTCKFCNHVEFIKWITLAQLVKSSSSSSGSSSSSSSSSSSGSFGGGRSSGGGAGGSW